MKRILIAATALVVLLGACSKKSQDFTVTATGLPDSANGTYAYIYNDKNQPIDSVKVQNGGFTYTTPACDTVVYTLNLQGTPYLFAPEAGKYTLATATDSITGEQVVRRGGDANSSFVKLQSLNDELAKLNTKFGNQMNEIQANIPADGKYTDEQKAKLEELYEQSQKEYAAVNRKYYDGATNKVINVVALQNLTNVITPTEFVELYDKAGSMVKSNEQLSNYYKQALAATKTDVGGTFVDFEMTNAVGETKKLSDFRQAGKYFLVDFFASWCPPCKASMPILSKINKEFGKNLSIVSVSVSDKYEDFNKILDELKVNWAHFHDNNNTGAETYGVAAIPTFVLYSPEGEILARTHDVEEIGAKLGELLK